MVFVSNKDISLELIHTICSIGEGRIIMEKVHRKIAYLTGLIEGSDVDLSSKEGKIIQELIHLMNAIADELEQIKLQITDQEEYLEALDEDLGEIEEFLFEEDDEDDDDFDDDENYYEVECPHCHEEILVDEDVFVANHEEEIICPECKRTFKMKDIQPVITKHIMDIENNKGEIHYYT